MLHSFVALLCPSIISSGLTSTVVPWQARRLGGFEGFGRTALRLERSGWRDPAGEVRLGFKSGGRVAIPPSTCMSGPGHVRVSNYNTQSYAGKDGRRIVERAVLP